MGNKAASRIMLILLLTSMLTLAFNIQPVRSDPKTWTVDDDGPADFHTIQEAINAANPVDTILVCNGTYFENVDVTKPVKLLGENRNTTIIDGNNQERCVSINPRISDVVISGFTIQNANYGISLPCWSSNHVVSKNIITKTGYGISANYMCFMVTISDNLITSNHYSGIFLGFSHGIVNGNIITNHKMESGIVIVEGVMNNTITGNTMINNHIGLYIPRYAEYHTIYHNDFINNTNHVNILPLLNISTFTWDDGYRSSGNYWSNYTDVDLHSGPFQNITGGDGIWDHPYVINKNNQDRYPLRNPWKGPSKPPIPGDTNYDWKVDIQDIDIVIQAFASYPTHPKWNPNADIDKDDRVDMVDIMVVITNFGQTV